MNCIVGVSKRFLTSPVFMAAVLFATLMSSSPAVFGQTSSNVAFRQDLDAFIERVMTSNLSPGVAVAVVRGADVIYTKGFGFADRESGRRASADTQFYIASTTKSFTALAASLLAGRGEIDLNAPLSQALPGVALHPQLSAEQITLRDLLTHTHGIKDLGPVVIRTAYTGEFTNLQLRSLLRLHPPSPAGRAYRYSNLGFNIFGMVLDEKFKEGWKRVLQREIFDPLGMQSTTAFLSRTDPNRLAQPYVYGLGVGPERIEYAKRDENMQAAGGHVSTANDFARYLLAHLNGGRIGGRQVLPESAIRATHHQQIEQDRNVGSFHWFGGGLGWDLATYNGETVLMRFGGFRGFDSHVSFMPEHSIGVVILGNGSGGSVIVSNTIATYTYERLLAEPNRREQTAVQQWKMFREKAEAYIIRRAEDLTRRRARPQTTPLPLGAYVGAYESPALGRMTWSLQEGRLRMQMGIAKGDAEAFDGPKHQFRVTLVGNGTVVAFSVEPGARQPSGLHWADHEFTRVP